MRLQPSQDYVTDDAQLCKASTSKPYWLSSICSCLCLGRYYPPDYDPSQGSLNKVRGENRTVITSPRHFWPSCFPGKHALGDRARKIDQGILIVRFELPFNIWWYVHRTRLSLTQPNSFPFSDGCNNHIGMGVRYNAEKKKIGNYYSTPIFSFRCKCHLCDNWFEIQTDPKVGIHSHITN